MAKEIKLKDKDGFVYPLPKIIYMGSQLLYAGTSGSGGVSKTNVYCCQGYNLVNSPVRSVTIPSGYHREYRISAMLRTQGGNNIHIYLNDVEVVTGSTWSNSGFRMPYFSRFLKESDLPLQTTFIHPNNTGLNLQYSVESSSYAWEFYNVTAHAYLVAD